MDEQSEIARWRLEERHALIRHATAVAAQAARANGQGREGADSAAAFVAFVLEQAFTSRDAELAHDGVQQANRTEGS